MKNTVLFGAGRIDHTMRITKLFAEEERLEKMGFLCKLPANTILLSPGDRLKCCYFLKSGMITTYELSRSGAEREYDVVLSHSLLGETLVIADVPCPVYYKTVNDSELICIDRDTFLDALRDDFELNRFVMQSLSYSCLSATDEIRQTRVHSAAWRICNLLLVLAGRYGIDYDGKVLINQKISQQIISNRLGLNRITTTRIMKTLKELQLIEQVNGFYCVRDVDRLEEYRDGLGE